MQGGLIRETKRRMTEAMETVRLHFCDFSSDFVAREDCFFKLLSERYRLVLDRDNPQFVIYSCYGYHFLDYDCPRIFYTAENIRPDFNLCDYAIGFDYLEFGDRYLRFPNYARYGRQFESLVGQPLLTGQDLKNKRGFCNFIYSNSFADPTRDQFFHLLLRYKHVDSPGRHLNNMPRHAGDRYAPDWRSSKAEFQQNYKFTIAFENSSSPGYTTEKIMHAFLARTIPIYWGNPLVAREFNPKSFINCHDFASLGEVVRRVIEVDSDEVRCLAMLNEPCLSGNVFPDAVKSETLLDFFSSIFSQPSDAARRRPRHGTTLSYEAAIRERVLLVSRRNRLGSFAQVPLRLLRRVLRR